MFERSSSSEVEAGVKSENPAVDFSGFPFLPLPMRTGELRPLISLQFLTFSSSHSLSLLSCIVFYSTVFSLSIYNSHHVILERSLPTTASCRPQIRKPHSDDPVEAISQSLRATTDTSHGRFEQRSIVYEKEHCGMEGTAAIHGVEAGAGVLCHSQRSAWAAHTSKAGRGVSGWEYAKNGIMCVSVANRNPGSMLASSIKTARNLTFK